MTGAGTTRSRGRSGWPVGAAAARARRGRGRRADLGCAAPLDRAKVDHWLPVNLYIGGIEHAALHLLYARFFQKAFADTGLASVREPFKRLLCQGMVCVETYSREGASGRPQWFYPDEVQVARDAKGAVTSATLGTDGQPVKVGRVEKMSKSKRNTVDPQKLVDLYGADTARLFMLFAAPPELDVVWSEDGVKGAHRFLKRLWTLCQEQAARLARSAFLFYLLLCCAQFLNRRASTGLLKAPSSSFDMH